MYILPHCRLTAEDCFYCAGDGGHTEIWGDSDYWQPCLLCGGTGLDLLGKILQGVITPPEWPYEMREAA